MFPKMGRSTIGASRDSEDGEIFMKVRDTDVGILLIDEFEKFNVSLFNYFLNVLETGIMESSLGQQIDLNGFIIVLPLGKIIRRGANFSTALTWYQDQVDNLIDNIITNQPFNL